jgi:hypothetical protein
VEGGGRVKFRSLTLVGCVTIFASVPRLTYWGCVVVG